MRAIYGGLAVGLLAAGVSFGQEPPAGGAVLAMHQLKGANQQVNIQVSSPTIKPNEPIPVVHSDYGEKVSPSLQWSGVPATAQSLALVMEDPDAQQPKPFVHWLLYNLPASVKNLREALPATPRLKDLEGALQGRTSRGNIGYFGPRPPKTDPPHHYHFQLFALDAMLTLDPAASREQLLKAMTGHVLASGELLGTFKAPADAK